MKIEEREYGAKHWEEVQRLLESLDDLSFEPDFHPERRRISKETATAISNRQERRGIVKGRRVAVQYPEYYKLTFGPNSQVKVEYLEKTKWYDAWLYHDKYGWYVEIMPTQDRLFRGF